VRPYVGAVQLERAGFVFCLLVVARLGRDEATGWSFQRPDYPADPLLGFVFCFCLLAFHSSNEAGGASWFTALRPLVRLGGNAGSSA